MSRRPLYEKLLSLHKQNRSSFHTPGHKYGTFFPAEMMLLDFTELPETDALFEANGVILSAEQKLSELYSTAASCISAGGCSLAIQAMLRTAKDRGGKLLCARNAHRSAVNAMALLDIQPVWLYPKGSSHYTGRIQPEDVAAAFREHPDITACYLTSPSYYGEMCDIGAIARICHNHDAILLVDNAHGSHLAFMEQNCHPIALGADMTACSLHKTMPVLTGGAVLNIRTPGLAQHAKAYMSLFASTSPSYLIMSSIDLCVDYMLYNGGKADYLRCEYTVAALKKLAADRGVPQAEGLCDPLRLTLNTAACGIAGEDKQQSFFDDFKIDCEFCDGENAVLICTPFNREKDFQRLRSAILQLQPADKPYAPFPALSAPPCVMSLREAVLSPFETVPVHQAAGRIAADTVCPCPPGVPLIMPGEKITSAAAALLSRRNITSLHVVAGHK